MIKVYIHGRPAGQDFFPTLQDTDYNKSYLKLFLDDSIGSSESATLIIDKFNGNSYYTYLHRRNFSEKGGRGNSYLAITICLEKAESRNVYTIYELLEYVYNNLNNKVIAQSGNGEKFIIDNFTAANDILNQAINVVVSNYNSKLSKYEAVLDDRDLRIDTRTFPITTYSLNEVDSNIFKEDTQNKRVIVSKDYLPKHKTLETQNNKLAERISSLEKMLNSIGQEADKNKREIVQKYSSELSKRDSDISKLNNCVKDLQSENEKLKKQLANVPLFNEWKELKPKIDSFVNSWSNQQNSTSQNIQTFKPTDTLIKWINTILLLSIIVLLFIFRSSSYNQEQSVAVDTTENVVVTEEIIPSSEENIAESLPEFKINVIGYNGQGDLKPKMEYELKLDGNDQNCQFEIIEGSEYAEIKENKLVTKNSSGSIVIGGKGDGFTVIKRALNISVSTTKKAIKVDEKNKKESTPKDETPKDATSADKSNENPKPENQGRV